MPKKIIFRAVAASSLDGRIADPSGHFHSWGSQEDHAFLDEMIGRHDAIVVGRVTYEHSAVRGGFPKPTFVLTKNGKRFAPRKGVQFLDPSDTDIVQTLRDCGHSKILILGGTQTYTYFLHQGLLQDFFLTLEPWTFATGKTLFESSSFAPIKFFLKDFRRLNQGGSIMLHYEICP